LNAITGAIYEKMGFGYLNKTGIRTSDNILQHLVRANPVKKEFISIMTLQFLMQT
jgi:hypothetical protein